LKRERNPKKYIQDVITFLWREALAAEEVLKVHVSSLLNKSAKIDIESSRLAYK
jgi:hypothetical protein